MGARIHPTAVVEAGARLGADCVIGPFCHVGPLAELGAGVELVSHVSVSGHTTLGPGARVFPFAALGGPPQDLKAAGASGELVIGAECLIREGVTVNAGTPSGGGVTRIGARCVLLAQSHVAHDCVLGDSVVLSNQVLLGGHVGVGDHVMIGGGTAVHQHVRIGDHAFVAGLSGVEGDVPPFALAGGNRAHLFGLNLVGLRRRGFSVERIATLKRVYQRLFAPAATLAERLEDIAREFAENPDAAALLAFLRVPGERPLCAPRRREPEP